MHNRLIGIYTCNGTCSSQHCPPPSTYQAQWPTKPNPTLHSICPFRIIRATDGGPYSLHNSVFTGPMIIHRQNCISTSDAATVCGSTSCSTSNSAAYQSIARLISSTKPAPSNPATAIGPNATTTTTNECSTGHTPPR